MIVNFDTSNFTKSMIYRYQIYCYYLKNYYIYNIKNELILNKQLIYVNNKYFTLDNKVKVLIDNKKWFTNKFIFIVLVISNNFCIYQYYRISNKFISNIYWGIYKNNSLIKMEELLISNKNIVLEYEKLAINQYINQLQDLLNSKIFILEKI